MLGFYVSPYMRDAVLGPFLESFYEGCYFGSLSGVLT